eukprot:scaffold12066_cov171-Amphora_coffeaeformis.AAC.2
MYNPRVGPILDNFQPEIHGQTEAVEWNDRIRHGRECPHGRTRCLVAHGPVGSLPVRGHEKLIEDVTYGKEHVAQTEYGHQALVNGRLPLPMTHVDNAQRSAKGQEHTDERNDCVARILLVGPNRHFVPLSLSIDLPSTKIVVVWSQSKGVRSKEVGKAEKVDVEQNNEGQ